MYKRILVATDGSQLSRVAVDHAVNLARAIGAKLIAFHASPAYSLTSYTEGRPGYPVRPTDYEQAAAKEAAKVLDAVKREATAAKIECTISHEFADSPWQAILAAAHKTGADVIVMASHGRRGLSAFLLGSETQKVLTHSTLPVVVVR